MGGRQTRFRAAARTRSNPSRAEAIDTIGSPLDLRDAGSGLRTARPRIVTAAALVEGARPDALLRSAAGQARGFWARGDRWVAHTGVVAALEVGAGPDRFRSVGEAAAGWGGSPRASFPEGGDARLLGRLRFYGGFAFRDDHHPSGFWETFPPALFLLPALELVGDAAGPARLRARALLPADADPRDARPALQELLARTAAGLADAPAVDEAPPPVPAARTELGRVTWEDAVEQALAAIRSGRFSKVVLARTLDVTTEEPIDPVDVVGHLWRENPGTHVFLFEPRPGRPLLGAAPETVATLRGGVFHATAVAGSIARGEDGEAQRSLAARLLDSAKDREEHRIAREDMLARLAPLAEQVRADDVPHVLTLARIQHLETEIRARVHNRPVLDLLQALHPTPAVCGHSRDAALDFLRGEEPFDRGWYSGPVGFFDEDGSGVFAPALRSAVAHGRTWRLFAGAGIVAGSRPELEWEETGIKFEPVLRALQASGARLEAAGSGGGGPAGGTGAR